MKRVHKCCFLMAGKMLLKLIVVRFPCNKKNGGMYEEEHLKSVLTDIKRSSRSYIK